MSFKSLVLTFVITTCAAAVSAQSDTCRACNCQFNNVQVLDQLIEDKATTALVNGSGEYICVHCMMNHHIMQHT